MSFFNRSVGKILFFTKNSPKYFTGEYSLILSPQFYWVKRVKLPVKSEFRAKKLAPSIFEGSLPEGEEFFYEVKYEKDRDTFIAIAYSKNYIYDEIRKKISPTAKVKGIYFAQHELKDLKTCISIDEDISLGNVDGLLIQVPSACVQSEENVRNYLPKVKLSNKKIKIDSLVDNKADNGQSLLYVAIMSLFVISQILTYFAYSGDLSKYDSKKESLIRQYNLPRTSFQLQSIKRSLLKRYKEQKSIRDTITKLDKIALNDDKFIDIVINKNSAKIVLESNPQNFEDIKKSFQKYFTISNTNTLDNILTVEVEHE